MALDETMSSFLWPAGKRVKSTSSCCKSWLLSIAWLSWNRDLPSSKTVSISNLFVAVVLRKKVILAWTCSFSFYLAIMTEKEGSVRTAQFTFSVQLETKLYSSQLHGGGSKQLLTYALSFWCLTWNKCWSYFSSHFKTHYKCLPLIVHIFNVANIHLLHYI